MYVMGIYYTKANLPQAYVILAEFRYPVFAPLVYWLSKTFQ